MAAYQNAHDNLAARTCIIDEMSRKGLQTPAEAVQALTLAVADYRRDLAACVLGRPVEAKAVTP
jgi:hypothetical protein